MSNSNIDFSNLHEMTLGAALLLGLLNIMTVMSLALRYCIVMPLV